MVDRRAREEAAREVQELAMKITEVIPSGTRPGLFVNAFKHCLAVAVISGAISPDAARNTMRLIGEQLCDNIEKMIEHGFRTWPARSAADVDEGASAVVEIVTAFGLLKELYGPNAGDVAVRLVEASMQGKRIDVTLESGEVLNRVRLPPEFGQEVTAILFAAARFGGGKLGVQEIDALDGALKPVKFVGGPDVLLKDISVVSMP